MYKLTGLVPLQHFGRSTRPVSFLKREGKSLFLGARFSRLENRGLFWGVVEWVGFNVPFVRGLFGVFEVWCGLSGCCFFLLGDGGGG